MEDSYDIYSKGIDQIAKEFNITEDVVREVYKSNVIGIHWIGGPVTEVCLKITRDQLKDELERNGFIDENWKLFIK